MDDIPILLAPEETIGDDPSQGISMGDVLKEVGHFASTVLAYALALSTILAVLWTLRRFGKRWPVEIVGFLERVLDADGGEPTVNVEYRDASGKQIDLTPLIKGILRNGHGRAFDLRENVFVQCDPQTIRAGAMVLVSLQGGLVKESLCVQLDPEKQILFVQSKKLRMELIDIISGRAKYSELESTL
jgi:hypothetical protein